MAIYSVNANRMELNRLETRLSKARRGHQLLKQKQNALMKQFALIIEAAVLKRRSLQEQMRSITGQYQLATLVDDNQRIQDLLEKDQGQVSIQEKLVEHHGIQTLEFSLLETARASGADLNAVNTSVFLDRVLESHEGFLPAFLELATLEKEVQILYAALKSTRRRVNALEYRTIPDLEDTLAMIRLKIEDYERSQLARLSKIT